MINSLHLFNPPVPSCPILPLSRRQEQNGRGKRLCHTEDDLCELQVASVSVHPYFQFINCI